MVWIQLSRPIASVLCYQRDFSCVGTKIFSSLPTSVSNLRMINFIFQLNCKGTLLLILFHSLEELLAYREHTTSIFDNK